MRTTRTSHVFLPQFHYQFGHYRTTKTCLHALPPPLLIRVGIRAANPWFPIGCYFFHPSIPKLSCFMEETMGAGDLVFQRENRKHNPFYYGRNRGIEDLSCLSKSSSLSLNKNKELLLDKDRRIGSLAVQIFVPRS